jgi:hypothetical protein
MNFMHIHELSFCDCVLGLSPCYNSSKRSSDTVKFLSTVRSYDRSHNHQSIYTSLDYTVTTVYVHFRPSGGIVGGSRPWRVGVVLLLLSSRARPSKFTV